MASQGGASKPAALWKLEGQKYVQRGASLGWRSLMAHTSFGLGTYRKQPSDTAIYQQHATLKRIS
jgi:hypothetical protein